MSGKISTPAEFEAAVATLTPYQQKVLRTIEQFPSKSASTWEVCWTGFAEQWNANRASHGAMCRAVLQAAQKMQAKGLVTILPPHDQNDDYTYCSRRPWLEANT